MKVCLITATKNRHTQLERVVRFVLEQTSSDWVHLIYNNAIRPLRLNNNLPKDKFILVNKHTFSTTGQPYTNLGDIYTDAMEYVPEDCDVINFVDDDDIYMPTHVEEGLKGLESSGLLAYKPKKSWYRYLRGKPQLVENTLEPSIFVKTSHIKEYGFTSETTAQHKKWVDALVTNKQIKVDPDGKPTYLCDWSQEIGTFKTSGDPNNPNNFQNYSNWSQDIGDGIITPVAAANVKKYYV